MHPIPVLERYSLTRPVPGDLVVWGHRAANESVARDLGVGIVVTVTYENIIEGGRATVLWSRMRLGDAWLIDIEVVGD